MRARSSLRGKLDARAELELEVPGAVVMEIGEYKARNYSIKRTKKTESLLFPEMMEGGSSGVD